MNALRIALAALCLYGTIAAAAPKSGPTQPPPDSSQPNPMPPQHPGDPGDPSNPETPNEHVIFNAFLYLLKCTENGNIKICTSNTSLPAYPNPGPLPLGNADVILMPDSSDSSHSSGHFLTAIGDSGLRFIGIVTVHKWEGVVNGPGTPTPPNPQPWVNYTFRVEVLGHSGPMAEMRLSADDPSKIAVVTLVGQETRIGNETFRPEFSISPVVGMTNPPSPGPSPTWTVIQGTLK